MRKASPSSPSSLILSGCLICSFMVLSSSSFVNMSERETLLMFWQMTYGAQWLNSTNWGSSNDPICSWFGVECLDWSTGLPTKTADEGVTSIKLPKNNLANSIPQEVWNLPSLSTVDLSQNALVDAGLTGYLLDTTTSNGGASSVTTVVAPLEKLDLSFNFVTSLHGLQGASNTLREAKLSSNNFAKFPTELYALTRLERLYINACGTMSGSLSPPGVAHWNASLVELYAYANALTGALPTELGLLNKLQVLSLSSNRFSSTIPTEFNNLINLEVLSLHGGGQTREFETTGSQPGMALTGKVPSFANVPRLSKLFLSDNLLTGSLPNDFLANNALKHLVVMVNLQNNYLIGGLPAGLRHFASLHINLVGNKLTLPLPDFFCVKAQWMHGLVHLYGCPAILCPAGTFSESGQQTSEDTACQPCPPITSPDGSAVEAAYYLGARTCPQNNNNDQATPSPAPAPGDDTTVDTTRVLLEFYLSLDGPRWENNDGWEVLDVFAGATHYDQLPTVGHVDFCQFHGIICNGAGQVNFLTLANNRLHGTVPGSIFQLPKLVSLDVSFNTALEVADWSGLSEAPTSLTRLKFSHTAVSRLTGIGHGKAFVTSLILSGIDLHSSLPDELFDLTLLETLQLDAADVVGPLSTRIGQLSNLRRLSLNENEFQGQIPTALNQLSNLEFLDLSDNDWTGTLASDFLNQATQLIDLRLNGARAGLGGPLPSLTALQSAEVVELAYNSFYGQIPADFLQNARTTAASATARASITIDLQGNELSGSIPTEFGQFDTPLTIKLQDNQITDIPTSLCQQSPSWMDGDVGSLGCPAILCPIGTWNPHGRASADFTCDGCVGNAYWGQTVCHDVVPVINVERDILDELFVATGGRYWDKSHQVWENKGAPICQREGILCTQGDTADSGVSEILLEHYGLRGRIPSSVYNLPNLRRLAVAFNPVELSFEGIENATNLEVIMASHTKIDGLAGLENATRLVSLHAASCGMTGSFPIEFLSTSSVRGLRLSDNRFSGSLPISWESAKNLQSLELDGNDLDGPLPPTMAFIPSLRLLDLSGNMLSGPLPVAWSKNMASLQTLKLKGQRGTTKITGPLLDFANCSSLTTLDLSKNQMAGHLPPTLLKSVAETTDIAVIVDLSFNQFGGGIPIEWVSFSKLILDLAENNIESIPSDLCTKTEWRDFMESENSTATSCDWILCPPHTSELLGRESDLGVCTPCNSTGELRGSPFYGAVDCAQHPVVDERSALLEFYQATAGDEWVHSDNWGSNLNICTWYGVICGNDLTVAELRLENNGLAHAEADTMYQDVMLTLAPLTNLRLLDLKGNNIELKFEKLKPESKLENLRVSKTSISSLQGIENAKKLTSLHAMDNGMAGPFPEQLFQLTSLRELFLSFNAFSSELPAYISNLTNLEGLFLFGNMLEGQIPTSIALLPALQELSLGENQFSGTIPTEFNQMSKLERLLLQNQKGKELIEGQLPDFAGAVSLAYLDVSYNDIGPLVPDTLLQNSTLLDAPVTLVLRANDFTGAIPTSLNRFQELLIDLADNRITEIPPALCENGGWMNGAIGEVGSCDAILCPAGYFSDSGHQDKPERPCTKCDAESSGYFGQTKCVLDDSERAILTTLFEQTGGNSWKKNENWASNVPLCSWEGISCIGDLQDEQGVEVVSLVDNGLINTLPSHVWALPSLKELAIRGNSDLTVSLSGLENNPGTLEVLDVSNTRVTSLQGISEAENLRELYADQVGLTGPFPSELLSIETLEAIHMNWNFMVGSIPPKIGDLGKLKFLHAAGNDFHGLLPSSIGFLAELEELVLDDNMLSGSLPAELSYLPRLRHFSIVRLAKSGRKLTEQLPAFDRVSMLESLGLENNDITGAIPPNFLSSSVGVQEVVLNHNDITGSIPDGLASLSSLHFSVVDNEISEISSEFCTNNQWLKGTASLYNNTCDAFLCAPSSANEFGRAVDLKNPCVPCGEGGAPFYGSESCDEPPDEKAILTNLFNSLHGSGWKRNDYWLSKASVCDWYGIACDNGNVVAINLVDNQLQGIVSSEIFRLRKLQLLWLSSNDVQMSFGAIGHAKNLLDLRLDNTGQTSLDGIGNGRSLTALSIASNKIHGAFPSALLQLENIRYLDASNNMLTGSLPNSLSGLRYIRFLSLSGNRFSGSLPAFSDSLNLVTVRVAGNQLQGDIPTDFLQSLPTSQLVHIDLSNNKLSHVPEELTRFDRLSLSMKQNQITSLPPSFCGKTTWNNGDVGKFGCDGIMCPPSKTTQEGRHIDGSPCVPCPNADPEFFGQSDCASVDTPAPSAANRIGGSVVLITMLCVPLFL